MITDNSNGRLAEIKAFAHTNGLEKQFNDTFSRLELYSGKGYNVILYNDFAPLSMEFAVKENDRHIHLFKIVSFLR